MRETMRIGFLGAGVMARALAPRWLAAGHDVLIGARDTGKAAALADEIGARAGTLTEAAEHADAAVLAVRWEGVKWTLDQVATSLQGKTLIDVTNPVEVEGFTVVTPPGMSLAEQTQTATGARVVKAFNLAQASVWTAARDVDGRRLVVPIATDDPDARATVERLVAELGYATLDVGELPHARHLEAMAAVVIRRLFTGDPASSTFAWVG